MTSVIILSGGLDSTVCMGIAQRALGSNGGLIALSFDYGQRHRVELEHAAAIADHYGAEHLVVRIDASQWGGSALTDERIEVPDAATPEGRANGGSGGGGGSGGDGGAGGGGGAVPNEIPVTYVPARNLIFLAVAMGVAEARNADDVYIGINALDYSGYPDCRPEFVESFAATAALALKRGVEGRPVVVHCPLADLTKAGIVRLGIEIGAPIGSTWSCYRGGEHPCASCDSCALRARGFAEAGVPDPALAR